MRIVILALLCLPSLCSAQELTQCQKNLIAHGVVFRGSAVCNDSWLDRNGSIVLLHMAQACNKTAHAKEFMNRGFMDFDRHSADIGKTAACEKVDGYIRSLENDSR